MQEKANEKIQIEKGEGADSRRQIRLFLLMLAGVAVVFYFHFFEGRINYQNTTAYAISYRFGFLPRGFVGTLIAAVDQFLPFSLYSYRGAFLISYAATGLFFVSLFLFYHTVLHRVSVSMLPMTEGILLFLSVILFSEFWTWNNFGRLDEYLVTITLLALTLLVAEKAEWLVFPLCVVAGLVHIGFVFTNINILLAVLLLKAMENPARRKKYLWIFGLCLISVSALFLYFEVFQPPVSDEAYKEIVSIAESLSEDGKTVSHELLDSELLKKDVFDDEWQWHLRNYIEFPLFLLFFSPLIALFVRWMNNLFHRQNNHASRFCFFIAFGGVLTLVPEYLLKVDYGRWVFCTFLYFGLMVLWLLTRQRADVEASLAETGEGLRRRIAIAPALLVLYPLLFVPFRDVFISDLTTGIMNAIAPLLGLW